jgi:hypothetical protein
MTVLQFEFLKTPILLFDTESVLKLGVLLIYSIFKVFVL